MSDHAQLEAALAAVALAARACAHVQSSLEAVRAITKDDKSPVTIADFASQAVVAHHLREHLGPIVLVAEESAAFLREPAHTAHLEAVLAALKDSGAWPDATPDLVLDAIDLGEGDPRGPLARADGFWTLDPIDGTKGFLRNQQYAVSLASIDPRGPRIGILGCPNLSPDPAAPIDPVRPRTVSDGPFKGCIFHAMRSHGANQQSVAGNARIAHPGLSPSTPVRLAESVESAHSDQSASQRMLAALGPPTQTLRLDSQAKYAVVARGQADLYLRLPTRPGYVERIWDHAAGALIAQEAGCTVTDTRGNPLDFSRGRGLESNSGVVCAPPALHAEVVRVLRSPGLGQ